MKRFALLGLIMISMILSSVAQGLPSKEFQLERPEIALVFKDRNFNDDGTFDPQRGRIGQIVYEVNIRDAIDGVRTDTFERPGTAPSNTVILTGPFLVLPEPGRFTIQVKVINVMPDGSTRSGPVEAEWIAIYDPPIPPTPTPLPLVPTQIKVEDLVITNETDFR